MYLSEFDYDLPEELIAQVPSPTRDQSRLMLLDRQRQSIEPGWFSALHEQLRPGDLLVLNDTRVIPARLLGEKETGGKLEVFLIRRLEGDAERWQCLTKASHAPRPGCQLQFPAGLSGVVESVDEDGTRVIRFDCAGDFRELLEEVGRLPLPPYIRREVDAVDRERYQTVFARNSGALAAPTAGLHFTEQRLQLLRQRGIEIVSLTLHVGLGTFLPVRSEDLSQHRMHAEEYEIPSATATAINKAKSEGRRVIALGTTATRALESAAVDGQVTAGAGTTRLFILPGYRFQVVDGLITNFHLPKSTLLMLVSAFAGKDFILQAYRRAVEERFRFFSYGDAMLIL